MGSEEIIVCLLTIVSVIIVSMLVAQLSVQHNAYTIKYDS
jgi:hypothetical protein